MFIYSNIVGTFVFSQNYKMREHVLFTPEQVIEYAPLLEEGKTLPTEEPFLKKFKNIADLQPESLHEIYEELVKYADAFRENNMFLTQHQVRESVSPDRIIIQAEDVIGDLQKSINMLSKRLREWYGYILPEAEHEIDDHKQFAKTVAMGRRAAMKKWGIRESMGKDIDDEEAKKLAKMILALYEEKESKEKYLEEIMQEHVPNLAAVTGPAIGAKLLGMAGSLRDMVMMPASTIQLLGAEKALFRHMTKHTKPPKHGIIIEHPLVQNADRKDRGKAARTLADKISMAVKVDFFKGDFIGDKLVREMEERMDEGH